MAFWGCEFLFDGIPSSHYGLMIYTIGFGEQSESAVKTGEIIEDRIAGRYDALTYGLLLNQPLEFTMTFGANMQSMDAQEHIDRYETEAIAAWLTGHKTRKWLSIFQDDMHEYRYKAYISDLQTISFGNIPWAFTCTVNCDSAFAYTYPEEVSYSVNGTEKIRFFNRSSYNGYYCPKMEITLNGGNSISIENETDSSRVTEFAELPASGSLTIYLDNKNKIITNSQDLNLYPYFNMRFLRLVRGDNILNITGNADIKFICEFPVNIGG